jgi:hypothetical protein
MWCNEEQDNYRNLFVHRRITVCSKMTVFVSLIWRKCYRFLLQLLWEKISTTQLDENLALKQRASLEADSRSANQKNASTFTEREISFPCSHESTACAYPKPDESISHTQPLFPSKYILILFSNPRQYFPKTFFLRGFPTKIWHAYLVCLMRDICRNYFARLVNSNVFLEECKQRLIRL